MTLQELQNEAKYKLKLPLRQLGFKKINGELKPYYEYFNLEYYFNNRNEEIGYYDIITKKINIDTKNRIWSKEIKKMYHKINLIKENDN